MSLSPQTDAPSLVSPSSTRHLPGEFITADEPLNPTKHTRHSLAQAVFARKAEYTSTKTARVKVGTWNVASCKGTENDLGGWFVGGLGVSEALAGLSVSAGKGPGYDDAGIGENQSSIESFANQEARYVKEKSTIPRNDSGTLLPGDQVDLYVLGLQEIVDINSALEALRPYSDLSASKKFKNAIEEAVPKGYRLIAEQQLIGLLLLIYAAPRIAEQVHSASTTSIGTGLMGYMGNKGAVTARIVLGETTKLVFVNSHLASGVGKAELERRNWDVAQIVNRTRFDSIEDRELHDEGERIGNEDYAFWFGDLNYRIEGIPADDVRRVLMLHTQNVYIADQDSERKLGEDAGGDILEPSTNRKSTDVNGEDMGQQVGSAKSLQSLDVLFRSGDDPTSLQATLDSLMPHDELHQQQKAGRAFHDGWRESPITFLPTYKYDIGSIAAFDSGEKKRGPSWCDRILYRTKKDRLQYLDKTLLEQQARERNDQMKAQGIESAAEEENTMFEYDPETDGDEDYEGSSINSDTQSRPGSHDNRGDTIMVEYYASHQRVLSSDHKPLDCVFSLSYDAIDLESKNRIHDLVAREIDRAENEGRPVVTVVVEGKSPDDNSDGIDFGHVRYDDPKSRFVTIANTGQVPAQFGFIDPHKEPHGAVSNTASTQWLSVEFHYPSDKVDFESKSGASKKAGETWAVDISKVFNLNPGDATSIDVKSHVKDKELIKGLNDGDPLEIVLILRVKDGRDHFLPIKASWKRSIQGRTIESLIRIPEGGIRALQGQKPGVSLRDDKTNEAPVMWSAPREIFRLTEAIENLVERITAEWSMLGIDNDGDARPPLVTCAGWPFVEESWTLGAETRRSLRVEVNEALDTDRSFDSVLSSRLPPLHRLEVYSEALLDFLSNLEDGVIAQWLWKTLETQFFMKGKMRSKFSMDAKRADILELLSFSPSHSVAFVLLTSMLARVSQEVANSIQSMQSATGVTTELPESPRVKVKTSSLNLDRAAAIKQLIQKNLAAVFADVLIRTQHDTSKGQGVVIDHKRELIEIFLETSP